MRYLVTGGAGFIGSHLADHLLACGHSVLAVDDLSTGSIRNIEPLKNHPAFSYVIDTIANERLMAEAVDSCDAVFHLAAAVGVRLIVERPVHTIETNIHGTEILLKVADKKKRPVFLTSTSEVYGKSDRPAFREDDDMILGPTTKARWSYACSKAIDEFLALSYHKERGLPIVIFRLFNTVGPRQVGHYGMVIPRFVDQALAGGPITVHGDGSQTRCFAHVQDVVEAMAKASARPEAVGGVFNIGSQEEVSIKELAERVRALAAPGAQILLVPYDQAYEEGFEDMRRRVPDLRKIRELIGYRPSHDLDAILRSIVEHKRKEAGTAAEPAPGRKAETRRGGEKGIS